MLGKKKKGLKKRTVVVKMETHQKLEKFIVDLVRKKNKPRITLDEAINELLDEHYKLRHAKSSKRNASIPIKPKRRARNDV